MMDSQTPSDFAAVLLALSDTVNLVPGGLVESAFFGILSLLVAFSTYCLVKEGLNTRARVFLLCTSLIMYVVSGVHWGLNVYTLMREIEDPQAWVALPARTAWLWSFITTIALFLNFWINDMVVMWRACALWNWSRSVLVVAGLFVVLPLIFACVDVATTQVPTSESHSFQPNAFGFVALLLSLLSNIWATALIGYKAWKHRRVINMHVGEEGKESRVLRVLTLLVESGLLYSLIWALFIFTRIFNGGSFSHAAHIIAGIVPQLVGVYPSLIIILVDFQKVRNQRNDALGPDSLGPGLGPTHSTLRFAGPTSHAGVTNSRITETSERQHETSVSNSSSSHSDSHTSWQDLKALEEAVPNADLDDAQEK